MMALLFGVSFVLVMAAAYVGRYSGRVQTQASRTMAVPMNQVQAAVTDFATWQQWAPWIESDPDTKVSCTRAHDGTPGSFDWSSPNSATGRIVNLPQELPNSFEQSYMADRPLKFSGHIHWQFKSQGDQTEVTWAFKGRVGFAMRLFAPTVKSKIELDFRYGLDRLAQFLENQEGTHTDQHYQLDYLGVQHQAALTYVTESYSGSFAGIGQSMGSACHVLRAQLQEVGIVPFSPPTAIYLQTNTKHKTTQCLFGFALPLGLSPNSVEGFQTRSVQAHDAYVVRLTGSYKALEVAWLQTLQRMQALELEPNPSMPPYERYLNDPTCIPVQQWMTELVIPIQSDDLDESRHGKKLTF